MLTEQQIAEKATTETVTKLRWWNDKLLTFTTTRSPNYSFQAGQYARLGLRDGTSPVWRAYSMTSSPTAPELEFYGVLVPGGAFTTRLSALRIGDPILVEKQPYGFMTPDRFADGEDLWMFATGTGVGPFVSMLRDQEVWQRFRRLILVHCVRHADEFAYQQELDNLQQKHAATAQLHILRAATRDQAQGVLHGRITTMLEDGTLEKAAGLEITEIASRIMLCGNPAMIEDMRRILHGRGLRPARRALPGHFVTENYW